MFLHRIVSYIKGKTGAGPGAEKVRRDVVLKPPPYVDRHKERDFLILATGPSLRTYRQKILEFIEKRKPIVMASNNMDGMFVPDYHGFTNRKRFCSYVGAVHPSSRLLISPYFPEQVINVFCKREYEEIPFKNIYSYHRGAIEIRDGVIYSEGATVATTLVCVAVVMGARNIYIAGMDGYSISDETHYYAEADDKLRQDLLGQEKSMREQLKRLAEILADAGGGKVAVITPTAYEEYYEAIENFL